MSRLPPAKRKKSTPSEFPEPRFEIDPNGRIIALPLYSPSSAKALKEPQEKADSTGRKKHKYIPIKPLILTPAELQVFSRPSKVGKQEQSVRKELFKVPEQKTRERFSTMTRRSAKKVLNNPKPAVSGTPLISIEEVDELPKGKSKSIGYAFKPLTRPSINFVNPEENEFVVPKIITTNATPIKLSSETGDLSDSFKMQKEFLEIEKSLGAAPQSLIKQSPISDVCNLLKSTNLDQSPLVLRSSDDILKQINSIIERSRRRDDENTRKILAVLESNRDQHEKDILEIKELVSQLATPSFGKENEGILKRRSGRLLDKEAKKRCIVESPPIEKSAGLRVSTVKKNFKRSVEEEASPRRKKALAMYNTLRDEHTVLCTPVIHRGTRDSPSINPNRSLSRRLQQQCLLLQDTPGHK